MYIIIFKVTIE